MKDTEMRQIAESQGIKFYSVYRRAYRGWTDEEIRNGFRPQGPYTARARRPRRRYTRATPFYKPKFGGHFTDGSSLFIALLFEVVSSIEKLSNKMGNWKMTCLVYRGLQDRGF